MSCRCGHVTSCPLLSREAKAVPPRGQADMGPPEKSNRAQRQVTKEEEDGPSASLLHFCSCQSQLGRQRSSTQSLACLSLQGRLLLASLEPWRQSERAGNASKLTLWLWVPSTCAICRTWTRHLHPWAS